MRPNTSAPIGRVIRARPTVAAITARGLPNVVAMSWTTNVRTKKSNASSVHPRNPARTALRWFARALLEMLAVFVAEGRSTASICRELYCPDGRHLCRIAIVSSAGAHGLRRCSALCARYDVEARRDRAAGDARTRTGRRDTGVRARKDRSGARVAYLSTRRREARTRTSRGLPHRLRGWLRRPARRRGGRCCEDSGDESG